MQITTFTKQPVLQVGFTGLAVKELQKLLLQRVGDVADLKVDGIFGEITQYAVKLFQYRVFLKNDGMVGVTTWDALYAGHRLDLPELSRGSYGSEVARVQKVLKLSQVAQKELGLKGYYFWPIDGNFDSRTEVAVKSFQHEHKLVVDGVIGAETWKALMELAVKVSQITG
jgi:peptidoglycan hydrolase-like protein with peptidoglycan-binding domain